MTREEVNQLLDKKGLESIKILTNVIFDYFESRTCEICKYSRSINGSENLLCGSAVCVDLDEHGQYVVTKDFWCNKWEK